MVSVNVLFRTNWTLVFAIAVCSVFAVVRCVIEDAESIGESFEVMFVELSAEIIGGIAQLLII